DRRLSAMEGFGAGCRPIRTDNRLHAWEWLVHGGRIVKVDAVDHCQGHDLIGCQDIAWDVAGAIVEHDLTAVEARRMMQATCAAGAGVDPELVAAMLPCYLAFQAGLWSTSPDAAAAPLALRYRTKLADWIEAQP